MYMSAYREGCITGEVACMASRKEPQISHLNTHSRDLDRGPVRMKSIKTTPWISASFFFFFFALTPHALTDPSAVCVIQKHAASLSVPGVPGVSRISVNAHSAPASPYPPCVEAMAPPTTTSVNSARPRACRRGGLMWRGSAAVMKVGNGLWNGVIMLTNRPLKWCNYLYQLTCGTLFSHLWIVIMVAYATSGMPAG